ncbi:MAG TPA: glycoside hydrolase family 18 [Muribaculaceae bacterium]|jgi:hypothetical protein|nr:glycoside hydrolase family 18 [Muribaculaceae bacterium]
MNKFFKTGLSALAVLTAVSFTSCDDWTETESEDLDFGTIDKVDPAAYAKYLQNLRDYRTTDHKKVYAWFNNTDNFVSQANRLTALPDSIDVVSLTDPANVTIGLMREMDKVRRDKGMEIIYTVDFDKFKAAYTAKMELATEEEPVTESFKGFLTDSLAKSLDYVKQFGFDGICIAYNGKATPHLDKDELAEYAANERLFIGILTDWHKRNADKSIDYIGKPQNLLDKSLLDDCRMIFLSDGVNATNINLFSYYTALANTEGVPAEKLGMVAAAKSVDPQDVKTGMFTDGTRALAGLASWVAVNPVAGIGIFNAQDDYYNPDRVYPYTRDCIQAANPSAK